MVRSLGGRLALLLAAAAAALAAYTAAPHRSARAGAARRAASLEWDVVVVGGGSAGAVVASRLSADPSLRVLLLEAGGELEPNWMTRVPLVSALLQHSRIDWAFDTVPQEHSSRGLKRNVSQWPRGKVLGGSSVLNYMAWVRGAREDYERWRDEFGAEGWGYEDVLPFFRRAERCYFGQGASSAERELSPLRGADGALAIRMEQPTLREASKRFLRACAADERIGAVDDYNGETMLGSGHTQCNIDEGGRRQDTARTYLRRELRRGRPNLHVVTRAHAARVVFGRESGTGEPVAKGVEFIADALGPEAPLMAPLAAGGEVVLSSGAVGTPLILQRSGVGPADLLKSTGIDVVVANDNVGANLQDHIFTPLAADTNALSLHAGMINPATISDYLSEGSGPLASDFIEVTAFLSTGARPDLHGAPDIQLHFVPARGDTVYCKAMGFGEEWCDAMWRAQMGGVDSYNMLPTLLHPLSTGHVNVSSADPLAPPRIDPNYLSDEHGTDVRTLREGLRIVTGLIASEHFRDINVGLTMPFNYPQAFRDEVGLPPRPGDEPTWLLPNATDEAFWEAYIRHVALTVYHPTSTCAIGAANGSSCALPDMSVRGVRGVRVADASAMPAITSGNTNAPCIMLGERAAELVAAALRAR